MFAKLKYPYSTYVRINGPGPHECEVCGGPMTEDNCVEASHCWHCGCYDPHDYDDYTVQDERRQLGAGSAT